MVLGHAKNGPGTWKMVPVCAIMTLGRARKWTGDLEHGPGRAKMVLGPWKMVPRHRKSNPGRGKWALDVGKWSLDIEKGQTNAKPMQNQRKTNFSIKKLIKTV